MADYTLPQGRELDAMVAEKVMALPVRWASELSPVYLNGDWDDKIVAGPYHPPGWSVKRYSSSIADAGRVKAEMVKRGYWFQMEVNAKGVIVVLFGKSVLDGKCIDGHGFCICVEHPTEADEARCIVSAALDALRNAGEVTL